MEEYSDRTPSDLARYPMVPIRDVVIFPFTKVAFKIGRPGSVRERATTVRVENDNGAFTALIRRAPVVPEEGTRVEALVQKINQLVEQHLRLAPDAQTDALQTALRNQNPSHLADALASQLRISVEDKQGLLEIFSTQARLQRL